MNVLVVDDDRTTRFLLRRALTNELSCSVTDAADGIEALQALSQGEFGLVVLDVQMPRLDGVETLRRIRSDPEMGSTPVVMLTAERAEPIVRQIVELGVLDYMTKPLTSAKIVERVRRVLAWLSAEDSPAVPKFLGEGYSLLDTKVSMLVVDGDDEYRSFFAGTFGPDHTVLQARSGVEGLRLCVEQRPDVVFVGDGLGVLGEALFVRKIRASPTIQQPQLIAIVDEGIQADRATHQEGYNGKIKRSADPLHLLASVKGLLRPAGGGIQELRLVHPNLRAVVVSGAEQVLGMMLGSDVAQHKAFAGAGIERYVARQRGAWGVNTTGVDFLLYADERSGRALAGHLLGLDPAMVTEEDVVSALAEVFNMVSGRLRAALATKGLRAEFDLPQVYKSSEPVAGERPETRMTLCFRSLTGQAEFWMVLRTEVRQSAADGAVLLPVN